MAEITLKVRAKINLSLGIRGIDDRGYHDLDMLLLSVDDIYDIIKVKHSNEISVIMDDVVCGENNTAYKALKAIKDTYNVTLSAEIEKNIPMSAGLGGSSCDAAGVFCAFSKLNGVRQDELYELADSVGSDVVFMMRGGSAISRGQGSDLTFVELPSLEVLIMKAKGGSDTGKVFRKFDEMKMLSRVDNKLLIDKIKQGREYSNLLINQLYEPACVFNEEIKTLYNDARKVTDYVVMSGSGSSIVAIIHNDKEKERLLDVAKSAEYSKLCHTTLCGVEKL